MTRYNLTPDEAKILLDVDDRASLLELSVESRISPSHFVQSVKSLADKGLAEVHGASDDVETILDNWVSGEADADHSRPFLVLADEGKNVQDALRARQGKRRSVWNVARQMVKAPPDVEVQITSDADEDDADLDARLEQEIAKLRNSSQ